MRRPRFEVGIIDTGCCPSVLNGIKIPDEIKPDVYRLLVGINRAGGLTESEWEALDISGFIIQALRKKADH